MNKAHGRHGHWAFPMAAVVLLLDVLTKEGVRATFVEGERVPITSFFNLVYVYNPGAAFSFLANAGGWQRLFFTVVGLVISLVIAFMLLRQSMSRVGALGFAGVLGGALGNVTDRIRHGAVVDWLDFHVAGWHWPAFNIADVGISLGVAALVIDAIAEGRRQRAGSPSA